MFLLDFEVGEKDAGVKAFKCFNSINSEYFKCQWYKVMWYVLIPTARNDAIFSFLDNSSLCFSLIPNFSFFVPHSPMKAPPIVAEVLPSAGSSYVKKPRLRFVFPLLPVLYVSSYLKDDFVNKVVKSKYYHIGQSTEVFIHDPF